MLQLTEDELIQLMRNHRISDGETELIISEDFSGAAVHHAGKIQCFYPGIERALSFYRKFINELSI